MGNSPCFALKVLYHSDVNLYIAFSLLHGNNGLLSIKFLCVTLWHMSICARAGRLPDCNPVPYIQAGKPRVPVQPGILFHGQQIVPKGKVSFGLHSFLLRFVYL